MKLFEVYVRPRAARFGDPTFVIRASTEEARMMREWLQDLKKARVVSEFIFQEVKGESHVSLASFLKTIDTRP